MCNALTNRNIPVLCSYDEQIANVLNKIPLSFPVSRLKTTSWLYESFMSAEMCLIQAEFAGLANQLW